MFLYTDRFYNWGFSFCLFKSKKCFLIFLWHVEIETKKERNPHHMFSFLITAAVFLKFKSPFLRKSNLQRRNCQIDRSNCRL